MAANEKQITALPQKLELTQGIRSTYQSLSFVHPILGFSGKHNELVFIPDTSANGTQMLVYNFNNKSWTKITYATGNSYSNFVYGDDDMLMLVKRTITVDSTESVQNGDCASVTGWAYTNWTYASEKFDHNTSNTSALVNTGSAAITANARYRVVFTVSGMSAGTFTVAVGNGTASGNISMETGNITYSMDLVGGATSTEAFRATPVGAFDGAIDDISVKRLDETFVVEKYKGAESGTNDNTTAVFKTKDFVFGEPHAKKYVSHLTVTYKSAVDLDIKIYVDGIYYSDKKLTPNNTLKSRKIKINTECQAISFEFTSDNTGGSDDAFVLEDFIIEGWYNDKQ